MKNSPPLLLTPGPVSIPQSLLQILSEPMIHHRSLEFANILQKTQTLLKKMFQTKQDVLLLNSSGTGAMSAALLNTLSPGDTVLALCAGKFGERWADMAKSYKLNVIKLSATWGKAIFPEELKRTLKKHPQIKAVLGQACETSTGVIHPVETLASTIQKENPEVLFIVDAISALGAVNIPMDKWGIDIMIGGSQKSFCLPAGMAFITLSEKAWNYNKTAKLPVYYFDLKKEKQAQSKGQTAFSTNVSFIRALHAFLSPLEKEDGLKKLIQKSEQLSQITLKFCNILNIDIFGKPNSPSVTSIQLPAHIDGVTLQKQMEKKHKILLGGGQDQLKGRIIRIGHIGGTSIADLKKGLKQLSLELHSMDTQFISKKNIEKALSECF